MRSWQQAIRLVLRIVVMSALTVSSSIAALASEPMLATDDDPVVVERTASDGPTDPARNDEAEVSFEDAPAQLEVSVTPHLPGEFATGGAVVLPSTGGDVIYEVTLANTSRRDALTITSASDDRFNIPGDCVIWIGYRMVPGERIECEFVGRIDPATLPAPQPSSAPITYENVITVTAEDDDGIVTFEDARATVYVGHPRCMLVTMRPEPAAVSEPGGEVVFTVEVANCSERPFTIFDVSGDGSASAAEDCLQDFADVSVPTAHGFFCVFVARVDDQPGDGPHLDTVTIRADYGADRVDTVDGSSTATVLIEDIPSSIEVTMRGGADPSGPETAVINHVVVIENTSPVDDVRIDDVMGVMAGGEVVSQTCSPTIGTWIEPGRRAECTIRVRVSRVPEKRTDSVSVYATDDDGQPVSGRAETTVRIPASARPQATGTAQPSGLDETGATPHAEGWALIGLDELRETAPICVSVPEQEVTVTIWHTVAFSAWPSAEEAQASIDRELAKERSPTWQTFPDCGAARTPRYEIGFVQVGLTEEEARAFIAAFVDDERRYAPFSGPTWVTLTGEGSGTRTEVAAVIYEEAAANQP